MENLIAEYGASAFVALIAYFLLVFAEDLLGIHKVGRAVYAVIIAILYYYFGDSIGPAIQSILGTIGLNETSGDSFKGFK